MVGQVVVVLGLLRDPLVEGGAVAAEPTDLPVQLLILLDLVLGLQRRVCIRLDMLLAVAPRLEDLSLILLPLTRIESV